MIVRSSKERPTRIEELIEPSLASKLDRLDFRTRRLFAGKLQGERRSKKRGHSVEFDDYRDYVAGDDLRHIDWNVYARFDRLFIKLFLEEEDLALHVAVDASASMDAGNPSKLAFAARLAMALAYIGLAGNNRVGLSVFGAAGASPGDQAWSRDREGAGVSVLARLPDLRGKHHLARVAGFLLDSMWPERPPAAEGGAVASFGEALTTIAKVRSGKGVLVVISDFLVPPEQMDADPLVSPGYVQGLRSLAAATGYETYVMQVLSPGEIEPEREAGEGLTGDLRLTDVETGRAAEITLTAPLLKKYKERMEKYCAALHSFCVARRMTHVLVRSDASVEQIVMETLRRSGMVG